MTTQTVSELPKILLIVGGLLILLAVPAAAQKVSVGYDHTADFSKFRTYSWTKGMPAKDPGIDQQIVAAIDSQLEAKGLKRTNDKADLNVSYHAIVGSDVELANVARPGTWSSAQSPSMTQGWLVVRGALIIEIQNSDGQDVWRATATKTFSSDPREEVRKDRTNATRKITKAVEKMFKKYPVANTKP
jgi:Domain of unknown function (DUF4136)